MTQTNEKNCPLSGVCNVAGTLPQCTTDCSPYISVTRRYKASQLPKDYTTTFMSNSPVRATQEAIYATLDTYIKSFSMDGVRIKNVYLMSESPGTGKTTTASALLNEYIRRRFMYYVKRKEEVPQELALFLDMTEWQNRYNMATMSKDEDKLDGIAKDIERYSEVEFLVIDDIGLRTATEAFRGYVHTIINARTTNSLPIVFTSNVPITELRNVFDDRLYDRVRDQCIELPFDGQSKRGRR
ncbi:ATP-binding protein [Abyssicoccus albus]|uniref:DNA replication protein DnaC n=1 Tax=Abyssicoccus albus TaxID=1817405 RepID=A0A3N5C5U0_9BACL|nr:ATP-binding protein [Abyssicoccus albus]RPF54782.1 DNA replication protein DnaC [Abyssicoccus albus]